MSFDIRRASKEDLDRLNAEAKVWRSRHAPIPEETPEEPLLQLPSPADWQQGELWSKD